jgi:hypothetical protein
MDYVSERVLTLSKHTLCRQKIAINPVRLGFQSPPACSDCFRRHHQLSPEAIPCSPGSHACDQSDSCKAAYAEVTVATLRSLFGLEPLPAGRVC